MKSGPIRVIIADDHMMVRSGLRLFLMAFEDLKMVGDGFPALPDRYISVSEMHDRLSPLDLQPVTSPTGNGPARTYQIPGALGTIGFSSPLGEHFCQNCNRLRLTADGSLRPCLLQDIEIDMKETIRSGLPVLPLIQRAVDAKPQSHELDLEHYPEARRMVQIGG